jgi:ribosome-associated toxin RatA of RatAB toxin-antitoxin module
VIKIKKNVIVPFSCEEMFDLVSDIDNYHKFLPWCSQSNSFVDNNNHTIGSIDIDYLKVKTHFITKNINQKPHKIDITFVDGPFSDLHGFWQFSPLGANGCRIEFNLNYKFSNIFLEKIVGPVFSFITKNIIDCFIREAYARRENKY